MGPPTATLISKTVSWYLYTKELGKQHTYFTPVATSSQFEIDQIIGHISVSAAESAPFLNFCDSGVSTGPALK